MRYNIKWNWMFIHVFFFVLLFEVEKNRGEEKRIIQFKLKLNKLFSKLNRKLRRITFAWTSCHTTRLLFVWNHMESLLDGETFHFLLNFFPFTFNIKQFQNILDWLFFIEKRHTTIVSIDSSVVMWTIHFVYNISYTHTKNMIKLTQKHS